MTEFLQGLKDLKPEAVVLVVVVILVREFLSVIKSMVSKRAQVVNHDSPKMQAEMQIMSNTLAMIAKVCERVAMHIEAQTALIKDLTTENRLFSQNLEQFKDEFRRDLDQLSAEMRRSRSF